jgi:uncharacterized protein YecT (DUF1311 family)
MKSGVLLVVAVLTGSNLAHGQMSKEGASKAACDAALAKPFTAPPLDAQFKLDCDSSAFYFGIGRPVDYTAARLCAYVERANPRPSIGDMFYGPGVLSLIYANGQGVAPDFALALRFTCEDDWAAPAELEGRLDILRQDIAVGAVRKFDLCDTATSGLSEGACADIDSRLSQARRRQKVQLIADQLPASAQPAFRALQSAEDAFDDLRSRHEVDLSGTGRAAFVLIERDKLRDQFLINLQRVAARRFTSPVPLKTADRSLNAAYRELKSSMPAKEMSDSPDYGTLGFDGVRQTQRAWLALRDAWVAFATALHGAAAPDQVAAVITEQRAHQLKSLQLRSR